MGFRTLHIPLVWILSSVDRRHRAGCASTTIGFLYLVSLLVEGFRDLNVSYNGWVTTSELALPCVRLAASNNWHPFIARTIVTRFLGRWIHILLSIANLVQNVVVRCHRQGLLHALPAILMLVELFASHETLASINRNDISDITNWKYLQFYHHGFFCFLSIDDVLDGG